MGQKAAAQPKCETWVRHPTHLVSSTFPPRLIIVLPIQCTTTTEARAWRAQTAPKPPQRLAFDASTESASEALCETPTFPPHLVILLSVHHITTTSVEEQSQPSQKTARKRARRSDFPVWPADFNVNRFVNVRERSRGRPLDVGSICSMFSFFSTSRHCSLRSPHHDAQRDRRRRLIAENRGKTGGAHQPVAPTSFYDDAEEIRGLLQLFLHVSPLLCPFSAPQQLRREHGVPKRPPNRRRGSPLMRRLKALPKRFTKVTKRQLFLPISSFSSPFTTPQRRA